MFGKFRLIPLIAVLMLTAMPVSADRLRDSVVSQLRQQGYEEILVSRTWLGRTRILARRDGEKREIIINPRTGEILRDFWSAEADTDAQILSIPTDGMSGEGGGADDGGDDSGNGGGGGLGDGSGEGDKSADGRGGSGND